MSSVTFADVVHQSITFSRDNPVHAVVLDLVENPWFQRLRDISQTANNRLVYMFSEHSRFGHSLGVAHLADMLMKRLALDAAEPIRKYGSAVAAAALLHDIGHLAPGSHTAFKVWFPDRPDEHEKVAVRIVSEDPTLGSTLARHEAGLPDLVCRILAEDPQLPAWTWEIISGGGWNVDRGNWCIVDSILAGVNYGRYNIPALTDSIVILENGHLALRENRLDAMTHFAVSRHAMYRQMYQHRVLLAADTVNMAVVRRARDLEAKLSFADEHMRAALDARSPEDLTLPGIFWMRESWWRYHLLRWSMDPDPILRDLSDRCLNRRLFKTVRIGLKDVEAELRAGADKAVRQAGFDPRYYLHRISTADVHAGDYRRSMRVVMDDGRICSITEVEPLINSLMSESRQSENAWLALPAQAKAILGRAR